MNQRISACVQGTPRRGNEHIAQGIALGMMKRLSRSIQGATANRMGRVSPPYSLIQNRTEGFCASFAHLRRSALQPLPQCTA
ncbi:MAG: hypothetical protein SOW60_08645, partial [Bacteroidaceae bacterium]|nr:hypothetical protein [Bacteroidaceae bacterium]